jgi:uncharacterized protein
MNAQTTIPRRQVDFGFDTASVPRDWCRDDPFLSTFLDALSLLFPEGERFFVDSVKQHRDQIRTDELRARVAGFIGQEAMHGKEHRGFNDLLVVQGFTAAPLVEARVRRLLRVARRVLAPRSQLAVTCALEHFTAILAEGLLRHEGMRQDMHPSIRPLWVWHALEESEHKAVAFDVYRAAGGGYLRRAAIMLLTTAIFFAAVGLVHARLMATRGVLLRPWRWVRGVTRMWIWPGYFTRLVPAYFDYFRPRFHPDDRDTRALLDRWREQLFGLAGELTYRLTP